jgi:hypothetical protein
MFYPVIASSHAEWPTRGTNSLSLSLSLFLMSEESRKASRDQAYTITMSSQRGGHMCLKRTAGEQESV